MDVLPSGERASSGQAYTPVVARTWSIRARSARRLDDRQSSARTADSAMILPRSAVPPRVTAHQQHDGDGQPRMPGAQPHSNRQRKTPSAETPVRIRQARNELVPRRARRMLQSALPSLGIPWAGRSKADARGGASDDVGRGMRAHQSPGRTDMRHRNPGLTGWRDSAFLTPPSASRNVSGRCAAHPPVLFPAAA